VFRLLSIGRTAPLVLSLAVVLAACRPAPAPAPSPGPGPGPSATPPPNATAAPGVTAPPTATATPIPTPTPAPKVLVVCQTDEPRSLYLYAADTGGRAEVFSALFDGPIESAGYTDQPVILEALPSVAAGTAGTNEVEVRPGDPVVDGATGAVGPLAEGVQLLQVDGSLLTYTGAEPARTVQTWADFHLKAGVSWADGQPVTADDSVFSFEVAASPDTPGSKFVIQRTARYERVGDQVTRWTSLPGWLDGRFDLRFCTPLARHRYGAYSPRELLALLDINEYPLGWGPFTLPAGGWVRGGQMTLGRNPSYFRAAEGLPRLDQVVIRFGLQPEQILSELEAGACDLGPASVDFSGQLQRLAQGQAAGGLRPQFVPDTVFEHLDFGIAPVEGYKRAAGLDLFQDARVRQAAAYCLDRQMLIDQLLSGLSEVPSSYVPSGHPDFAGDQLARYPFDPARGQALLADAGWLDGDGDGVREQGRRTLALSLVSGPAGSPFREALAGFIAGQLQANCGIQAQPDLQAPEDLFSLWPDGPLFGRRFDLGTFPWRTGSEPPCDLYLTGSIPSDQNPGGSNDTGYSNPAFDQACRAAQQSLDPAVSRAQHIAAQVIFSQDLPSLPLFFHARIGVAGPRLEGYHLDPTASSDLWNVEEMSLTNP
jgi:peptide/nickel transport system substrate-binding protein